ncbi:hypothetical protein ARMGADRAFT_1077521 [Armillaria gallica]|uniref:Uncharacterized protein n=1 Tax=Armillaria gallica TaxID=47427 RepID=A0A2H3DLA8_ARMGA|nr:hypothetical protein ARMGADRAFT_1077521 [Armillaria gallica]
MLSSGRKTIFAGRKDSHLLMESRHHEDLCLLILVSSNNFLIRVAILQSKIHSQPRYTGETTLHLHGNTDVNAKPLESNVDGRTREPFVSVASVTIMNRSQMDSTGIEKFERLAVNLFLPDRKHPRTTIESSENLIVERVHPSKDKVAVIGVPGVMFTSGNSYRYGGHVGSGNVSRARATLGGKLTGMVE